MQLLFYLFTEHHILPSVSAKIKAGERILLHSFFIKDVELRKG